MHLDRDCRGEPAAVDRFEGADRQEGEAVERLAEHPALLGDHPLDDQLEAGQPDPLAHGVGGPVEQLVGHLGPDHRHQAAAVDVRLGERLAVGEAVVLHHLVLGRHPEHGDGADALVAVDHVARRRGPAGLERHRLRVGDRLAHRDGVVLGEDRAVADGPDGRVVEEAQRDRRAADLEGVGADHGAAEVVADVRVHPLDDGHHRHQESDRDDDAEEGEEGPELARPDGGEGEEKGFGEGHGGILRRKDGKTEGGRKDGRGTEGCQGFTFRLSVIPSFRLTRTSTPPPDPAGSPWSPGTSRRTRRSRRSPAARRPPTRAAPPRGPG